MSSSTNSHWYFRSQGRQFGPISLVQILHYILLQRLGADDEVSRDAIKWQPLSEVKALVPDLVISMDGLLDSQERAFLLATKRWADTHLTPREQRRTQLFHRTAEGRYTYLKNILVITGLLVAVIGLPLLVPSPELTSEADCSQPAAVGVNWSNCQMGLVVLQGVDMQQTLMRNTNLQGAIWSDLNLSAADLAYSNLGLSQMDRVVLDGADLRGADLSFATLNQVSFKGAQLTHANLTGARWEQVNIEGADLSGALWRDGSICLPGSVGHCLQAQVVR